MAVKTRSQLDALTNDALVTYIDTLTKTEFTYIDVDSKVRYFIYKYGKGVAASIRGTGLFFPAVMAQSIFESNYGKSIPLGSNNFAGIKYNPAIHIGYVTVIATEYIKGIPFRSEQKFAKFLNAEEGFSHHVKTLLSDRYKVARLTAKTPEEQIVMIVKSGYASLPASQYLQGVAGNIKRIINKTGILRVV
jgi:flagellum-specific peptidoglycan hydrolase FlgJ